MLKFTYTETGFHLERLAQSIDELVAWRAIVAMRVGVGVVIEPIAASFLLPADLAGLHDLEAEARRDPSEAISLCVAEEEYLEVTLRGTWISTDSQSAEGLFVTVLRDRAEFYILKCWQEAQSEVSVLKEVD